MSFVERRAAALAGRGRKKNPVIGVDALIKQLQALGEITDAKVQTAATKKAMQPVADAYQATMPRFPRPHEINTRAVQRAAGLTRTVGGGFASRNVLIKSTTARNRSRSWADVGVHPDAYYALQFVELGTSTQPAQPKLTNAMTARTDQTLDIYKRELQKTLATKLRKKQKALRNVF